MLAKLCQIEDKKGTTPQRVVPEMDDNPQNFCQITFASQPTKSFLRSSHKSVNTGSYYIRFYLNSNKL